MSNNFPHTQPGTILPLPDSEMQLFERKAWYNDPERFGELFASLFLLMGLLIVMSVIGIIAIGVALRMVGLN